MHFKNLLALKFLGLFTFLALQVSCSSKKTELQQVQLSANRKMSFGLRTVKEVDPALRARILELGKKGIKDAYQSQVLELDFQQDTLLETPENLFRIGESQVDDLFVADLESIGEQVAVQVSVLNGENLKNVTVFRVELTPTDPKIDETFATQFKKAALSSYPNPNIYPRSNPKHYADLIFVLAKKREEEASQYLSCENASSVLKFYEYTEKLYQLAVDRGTDRVVGQQGETHQLTTHLAESQERAKVIRDCAEDAKRGFQMIYEFGTLAPENQARILKAIEAAGLEEILKKYTSKPVVLRFNLTDALKLSCDVSLRYDRERYSAWTKGRVPDKFRSYQILSLDPYYALMQKLVVMRASLPADSPNSLVTSFLPMKMTLSLSTLLNGEVSFGVDGKYVAEKKTISMAYPNSIRLTVPGFDAKTIENKSKELFEEKGWLALGSCKTIDGTITEDGLAYKFFGFPCN